MTKYVSDFIIGGVASVGATVFTNPLEVVKTRIQLQGELAKRNTYVKPYKSIINAFVTIAKHDGWKGLQKGLVPALYFQFIINSFRLSVYNMAVRNGWLQDKNGNISFGFGIFWGAIGGVIGCYCASPFFLIKTQLQSQAVEHIAVGYQHKHTGMMNAFKDIHNKSGIVGLWRGATSTIPRAAIGSGAQIATFSKTKAILKDNYIAMHPVTNSFCAGLVAGSVMSIAMTPLDVITIRLYNQGISETGHGLLYKGWFDCFLKILNTEGIYGLYKGFWANYLRISPHSTLVLVFFDELLLMREKYTKTENAFNTKKDSLIQSCTKH